MSLHRSAALAVLLGLAGAAPAAAAPVAIYGGRTAQDAPIALRVSADGRRLMQLLVHVDVRCDDGGDTSWSGAATFASFKPPTISAGRNVFSPARVPRRGSFRTTGEATSYYGDDGRGTLKQTLRGSIRRGVAHGTYSATLEIMSTQTGDRVATCRSGTLRWAARSAPGRVYAGRTSAGAPVVVQRTRDGRRVDSLWMSWQADCQGGAFYDTGEEFGGFPVSRAGRFGNPFDDTVRLPDGGTRTWAYQLSGLTGTSRASGAFRVVVTDRDAAGATTDTCDSTALRWTARSTPGKPPKARPNEIRPIGA